MKQFGKDYATEIARRFKGLSLNMAQQQLKRFERAGALVSTLKGRTRLYTWNPRYVETLIYRDCPPCVSRKLRRRQGGEVQAGIHTSEKRN